MNADEQDQLVVWLEERGHSAAEIEQVLAKVAQLDFKTFRDSVDGGSLDFSRLVDELLAGDAAASADDRVVDTTRE